MKKIISIIVLLVSACGLYAQVAVKAIELSQMGTIISVTTTTIPQSGGSFTVTVTGATNTDPAYYNNLLASRGIHWLKCTSFLTERGTNPLDINKKSTVSFSASINNLNYSTSFYIKGLSGQTPEIIRVGNIIQHPLENAGIKYIVPGQVSSQITLSSSTVNVKYSLYKNNAVLAKVAGTGNPITFTGSYGPGVYMVKTDEGIVMNGSIDIQTFPLFKENSLVGHPSNDYLLEGNGGKKYLDFNIGSDISVFSLRELRELFTSFNKARAWGEWLEVNIKNKTDEVLSIEIVYGPGLDDTPPDTYIVIGNQGITLNYKKRGLLLKPGVIFTFLEDGIVPFDVLLKNSQHKVIYTLYKQSEGLWGRESIVGQYEGDGSALSFNDLTSGGRYALFATYKNSTLLIDSTTLTGVVYIDREVKSPGTNWQLTRTYKNKYTESSISYKNVNLDIEYLDGFGNPSQTISVCNSPEQNNLVQAVYYDNMYRNHARIYLPFPVDSQNTMAVSNPFSASNYSYLPIEEREYAWYSNTFENSPVERLISSTKPGAAYAVAGKNINYEYGYNSFYRTGIWKLSHNFLDNSISVRSYDNNPTNLSFIVEIDEDNNEKAVFKDKSGNVILEREICTPGGPNHGGIHGAPPGLAICFDTYYVYDYCGQLVWVISPEGSNKLQDGQTYAKTSTLAKDYSYIYTYDEKNRLVEKQLPGKEAEYYVYDRAGRLILSQDGNMRQDKLWTYCMYDNMNRAREVTVVKDTKTSQSTRKSLQQKCDNLANNYNVSLTYGNILAPVLDESFVINRHLLSSVYKELVVDTTPTPEFIPYASKYLKVGPLYDLNTIIVDPDNKYFIEGSKQPKEKYLICTKSGSGKPVLTTSYYYIPENCMNIVNATITACGGSNCISYTLLSDFPGEGAPDIGYYGDEIGQYISDPYYTTVGIPGLEFIPVHGKIAFDSKVDELPIGRKIYDKIAVLDSLDNYVERAYYYDTYGRLIQTVEKNHLGGISRYTSKYDFTGNVLASHESHNGCNGDISDTKLIEYTYDHRGRLLSETTTVNESKPVDMSYEYDELGKLKNKIYEFGDYSEEIDVTYWCVYHDSGGGLLDDSLNDFFAEVLRDEYGIENWHDFEYFKGNSINPDYLAYCYSDTGCYYFPLIENFDMLDFLEIVGRYKNEYDAGFSLDLYFNRSEDHQSSIILHKKKRVIETHTYNTQGWITDKKSGLFDMSLKYYDPDTNIGNNARYSGDVSQLIWNHNEAGLTPNSYSFQYARSGFLSYADHRSLDGGAWTTPELDYSESINYDRNGNIQSLIRQGVAGNDPLNLLPVEDDLTYTYLGNKLISLGHTNMSGSVASAGVFGYDYDANGNMTEDERKGLGFKYNFLNLLSEISDGNDNVLSVTSYLADASKQSVIGSDGKGYAYLGSLVYTVDNGVYRFESTGFSGGRIIAVEGGDGVDFVPMYTLTDHLGSVRVVFTEGSDGKFNVVARNDYYAFGKQHRNPALALGSDTENRFLFNGKEKQSIADPGLLDYGFRHYDPETGRWTGMDLLMENYMSASPFAYVLNKPGSYIDMYGLWTDTPGGWTTSDPGEISAFINYVRCDETSFDDIMSYIKDAMSSGGGGGDGTINLPAINIWAGASPRDPNRWDWTPLQTAVNAAYWIWLNQNQWLNQRNEFWLYTNAGFSLATTGMQQLNPYIYLGKNASAPLGYSFKMINLPRIGKIAGEIGIGATVVVDAVGIYNYYNKPGSNFQVSPLGAVIDAVIAGLVCYYPIVGVPLLIVDLCLPGGIEGIVLNYPGEVAAVGLAFSSFAINPALGLAAISMIYFLSND